MSTKKRSGFAWLVWMTCLLPAWIAPGFAATYRVAQTHPNAADTNPGTDDKPFKTINAALPQVTPGDTVMVGEGVYRETIVIDKSRAGTATAPVTLRADAAAPDGSVVLDGTRTIPAEHWMPFLSATFGVRREDNVWTARHSPDEDCTGEELRISAWPYKLHPGGYSPDGGTIRYGTVRLFGDDQEFTLVPARPDAGLMADKNHADSEETQSHDYITRTSPKFLQPRQWIWYDDGRTDGADQDDRPVPHPEELKHRIFVRLPAGQTPGEVALAISVRSQLIRVTGARHVVLEGLHLRRANHTAVQVARSQGITLRRLTVESFGGGRKFYYAAEPNQHIYDYGSGIAVHTSDVEITECLIQKGTGKGITVWGGGPAASDRTVIRQNRIREIGPHPWGGGWAHGRGTGIGTGNACHVLIADNDIQRVNNSGVWVDGGTADSDLCIVGNRFSEVGNYGVFLELGIAEALVTRNTVHQARCGFRVGPSARRCRVIGNAFDDCDLGGAVYVFRDRVGPRRDTITGLAVAGNLFLRCRRQALATTAEALENPDLFFDGNVYHLQADDRLDKGFDAGGRWGSFDFHRQKLRESRQCRAADEHSQLLTAAPAIAPGAPEQEVQRAIRRLLTDELFNALGTGRITPDERHRILGDSLP